MHLELELVPAERHDELAAGLERVLDDVLHAVADAPHMYHLIRELADAAEGRARASSTARPARRPASCCAGSPTATS